MKSEGQAESREGRPAGVPLPPARCRPLFQRRQHQHQLQHQHHSHSARRWFLRWWWCIIVVNISRRPFICILRIGSRSCAGMHIQWVFNCFCETWPPPPASREDVVYSYGCDSRLCVDPQTDFSLHLNGTKMERTFIQIASTPYIYLMNFVTRMCNYCVLSDRAIVEASELLSAGKASVLDGLLMSKTQTSYQSLQLAKLYERYKTVKWRNVQIKPNTTQVQRLPQEGTFVQSVLQKT